MQEIHFCRYHQLYLGDFLLLRCLLFLPGLDAAALHFQNEHIDVRLDPTDASFVDVIHTDSKTFAIAGYGLSEAVGHIDFYPNGGYMQRGCHTRDNGNA